MTRSQKALAGFFSFSGTMHFVIPRSYEAMMPPSLPRHQEAVLVSGIAEIVGGLAVAKPSTRRFARWWLLALLVAIFPPNVHIAVNPDHVRGLGREGSIPSGSPAGPSGRGCHFSRWRCSGSGAPHAPDACINVRFCLRMLFAVALLS